MRYGGPTANTVKKPRDWRPDPLIVTERQGGYFVNDAYLIAKVTDLSPWGIDGPGWYGHERKRDPYERVRDLPPLFGKGVLATIRSSETEAWPLTPSAHQASALTVPELHGVKPPRKLWLWANELGDIFVIDAAGFTAMFVLAGADPKRPYSFTCDSSSKPLVLRDGRRWLGALMPVRLESGDWGGGVVEASVDEDWGIA